MDPQHLIDSAVEQAGGLSDFGAPDWRDGLDALIASVDTEAELNEIGGPASEVQISGCLATRLQVVDWWNQHPELADGRIERPVFIVGVSRSGTTALSHLLSVDPAVRSPRSWETSSPVPPPEAATYDRDERFLAAIEADENSMLHALNPEFKAMHHDPPDMPTECVTVMAQNMVSLLFNAMFNLPSYAEFLLQRDHVPTYEYHRRFLQLLQSRHPGRWVLKTPHHALAIEALATVYPDARFVWTHRDPAVCIASTASISHGLASTFTDADHRRSAGSLWTRILTEMITRLTVAEEAMPDRFVHVDYQQLVDDPMGTVRALYAALGEDLTGEAEGRMTRHVDEHVQHRWGRHTYTFEDFGLDRAALDDQLAGYRNTYGL